MLLDIADISILASYFIIGSTTSERQARAILKDIKETVKKSFQVTPLHIEGKPGSGWVLMDYGDIIIHLFSEEMRRYYDLEGLWKDGRIVVRML